MTLGERVRERRKHLGMTQEELADKTNLSRSSIALIENNKRGIIRTKIKPFADALEITPSELMGWSENKQEDPKTESLLAHKFENITNDLDEKEIEQLEDFIAYLKSKRNKDK